MSDDEVLALYERSVDDVYRYASRLTGGDRAWADDLVQETYLGLIRKLRQGQRLSVDTGWLIVSCRHRFLDAMMRDRRARDRELHVANEQRQVQSDGSGTAIDALDGLPIDQRTVLVLKYVDEMTVAEVAREIGRSVHATESLLARARAALRAVIDQGGQQ